MGKCDTYNKLDKANTINKCDKLNEFNKFNTPNTLSSTYRRDFIKLIKFTQLTGSAKINTSARLIFELFHGLLNLMNSIIGRCRISPKGGERI